MKIQVQKLLLPALALFIIGCSSDDNSNSSEESKVEKRIVLDVSLKTDYKVYNGTNSAVTNEAYRTLKLTHNYNEDGTIGSLSSIGSTKKTDEDTEEVPTYTVSFSYNKDKTLKQFTSRDDQTGEDFWNDSFNYNNQGQLSSKYNSTQDQTTTYKYSSSGILNSASIIDQFGSVPFFFTYNNKDQITELTDDANTTKYERFKYDNHKTPFANMNIDLTYAGYELAGVLPITYKAKNNIVEYTNEYGDLTIYTDIKYNADGYPSEITNYKDKERKIITVKTTYTYKTIEIKK
ncbi:hypothetical protein [Myroides odoratimimus]|uniref:hypothetical protein n=1 Tax=Myroides odoratimimus TaxID=76832 RepID=UPI002574DF73|nr:hypothetical protein [Myroides odoratimimus]MDM1326200.1 hypothetical protein [Myroides odoratimimus]